VRALIFRADNGATFLFEALCFRRSLTRSVALLLDQDLVMRQNKTNTEKKTFPDEAKPKESKKKKGLLRYTVVALPFSS
jgi:hypothetical protein